MLKAFTDSHESQTNENNTCLENIKMNSAIDIVIV